MTPFLFDFSGKWDLNIAEPLPPNPISEPESSVLDNRCPYPIPKVDEIIKDIESFCYRVDKSKFVSDLFACGALAISNMVDKAQYNDREAQYLRIIQTYRPEEQKALAEVFAKVYALLSSVVYNNGRFNDYLGEIFMRCNLGNNSAGQFFTPYHVSECMARMMMSKENLQEKANNDEIITINDPCCGGGGMLIAALDVMKSYGINYARNSLIYCGDIDSRCVHMTYLQLSLAGAPAIVKQQNALTRELWSVWYTPAFLFQYPRFHKYINLN